MYPYYLWFRLWGTLLPTTLSVKMSLTRGHKNTFLTLRIIFLIYALIVPNP